MTGRPRSVSSTRPSRPVTAKQRAAEDAFVRAVQQRLPPRAREALLRLRGPKNVPRWASKWRIDAPCVIAFATELRELAASLPRADRKALINGDLTLALSVEQGDVRRRWGMEIQRLDRLRISVRRERLVDRMAPQAREAFRREQLASDDQSLAPVSADPSHESKARFLERATDHYDARTARFNERWSVDGSEVAMERVAPQLRRHIEWLARFQLGESCRQIAQQEPQNAAVDPMTVRKGITRAAALIGLLTLRQETVGRPRRQRQKT